MTEGRRAGANFDVGVQQFVIALANSFEEIQHVRRGVFVQTFFRHGFFVLLLIAGASSTGGFTANVSRRAFVQLEAAMIDGQESLVAEKDVPHVVGAMQSTESFWRRG